MAQRSLFILRFNRRFDNLGDQFIFQTLLDALAQYGVVYVRGGYPGLKQTAPNDVLLAGIVAWNRLCGISIYSISPPGGSLWSIRQKNKVSRRWHQRIFDTLIQARLAFGKSVIPAADHSWCKELDWIGMRDEASLSALRLAGIQNVHYFPDLAFLAPSFPGDDDERKGICLSFRESIPELKDNPLYKSKLLQAISDLTDVLTTNDKDSSRVYEQVEEDASFSNQISPATGIARHQILLTMESFREFYHSKQFVVSNRLHCLLLGAYCGAIPILLTSRDHSKVVSLFETIGWNSLFIPMEDPSEIVQRFNEIRRQFPLHQEKVRDTFDKQRALGLSILQQLFQPE